MDYHEVLRPPLWTYAVAAGLLTLLCFTLTAAVGLPAALVVFAVLLAVSVFTVSRRSLTIDVDAQGLDVGGRRVPAGQIVAVTALDEDGMRRAAGAEVDARAHFVLRTLSTKGGVRIDLASPEVPYWLVSTRHPEELAEALGS
jgi:hypothetical protein